MPLTSLVPAEPKKRRGAKMELRANRSPRTPSRSLHRIWLAGLGALAKARQEGGDELFRELVKRGEEIEARGAESAAQSPALSSLENQSAEREIAEVSRLVLACAQMIDGLVRQKRDTERLIEAMLPESPVPTPPAVLQARRNAAAREELISEFGLLSSSDIAAQAGSRAKNKASLANRWKQEGKLLSVPHQGSTYYPAFQLDAEGKPYPAVAGVLKAFGTKLSDWGLALWFTGRYGWLGDRRPVDLLATEPGRVVEAAQREAAPLVF
jgi:poly(hydroxyalkanoate) granule-associated protein